MMPGAVRLLQHLKDAGVIMAVATSTSRSSFDAKLSGPSGEFMRGAFAAVVCGDEACFSHNETVLHRHNSFGSTIAASSIANRLCVVRHHV